MRRFLALLAVCALLWQSAGVVNAFEYDPTAHCCCGDHDASDDCGCPDCPKAGKLRWRQPASSRDEAPAAPAMRSCHARARSGLVTQPPSLTPPPSPLLARPAPSAAPHPIEPPPLSGRVPSVIVPPS